MLLAGINFGTHFLAWRRWSFAPYARDPEAKLYLLIVIGSVFAAGWVLVSAWRNVPVIDDWVYASSVEHLLKTGRLRISDYSAVYPIAQILSAALMLRNRLKGGLPGPAASARVPSRWSVCARRR
jgi:Trk-type K+ transport system membrane component